ncbi:unnamed protein product [Rodentolepis nana]|uniref:Protein kinase domain-containing protein n=1 Tax=Rodentolepis nana TaxID=102285 RepID=A0A158QJ11_RODNA|nr:unnamed protein product [Rodentolepis nana]
MPTPRSSTGAAHIPGVGDIVVGGYTVTGPHLNKAEIFLTTSSPLGHAGSWCEITPMLHSRSRPTSEFFNGSVYVASDLLNSISSVEMLSLFTEGPPQWTEVIKPTFKLDSSISFNGSLLFGLRSSFTMNSRRLHNWRSVGIALMKSDADAYEGIRAEMIDCAQIIHMPEAPFTKYFLLARQEFTWKRKFFTKASAQLTDVSMSLGRKSSILEMPMHRDRCSLIPTKVYMTKVDVVFDVKDLKEVGIQCGDEVYVAGVTASKPKYIDDSYGHFERAQLNQKATNLLNQSGNLREIHSTLSSLVSQPRLRMGSVLGTPIRFAGPLISQQPMTAIINQSPIMTCECGRQYTVGELERQLISMEFDASEALGRVDFQFSTNKPLRHITTTFSTFSSQDRVAAEASRITSAHIGEGGRQFTFTELSNPPIITSQYSPSARPLEQSGIRCNCGRHFAARTGKKSTFTCDCGRQYGGISMPPLSNQKCTFPQWRKLPPMTTRRYGTGAAHIPGVGDLVFGGYMETGDDSRGVHNAEIVLTTSSPLGYAGSGCEIAYMLQSRAYPKAEFFNGSVYVVEIVLTTSSPLGYAGSGCEIAYMLQSRAYPKAEFFNGSVYVVGPPAILSSPPNVPISFPLAESLALTLSHQNNNLHSSSISRLVQLRNKLIEASVNPFPK